MQVSATPANRSFRAKFLVGEHCSALTASRMPLEPGLHLFGLVPERARATYSVPRCHSLAPAHSGQQGCRSAFAAAPGSNARPGRGSGARSGRRAAGGAARGAPSRPVALELVLGPHVPAVCRMRLRDVHAVRARRDARRALRCARTARRTAVTIAAKISTSGVPSARERVSVVGSPLGATVEAVARPAAARPTTTPGRGASRPRAAV